PRRQPNRFYRGFNQVYATLERHYVRLVSVMAHRPHSMALVFLAIVACAGLAFAMHATAFLPVEDQGYCLIVGRLPEGASQPRLRELAADLDRVLRGEPGVKGWVTSGGFSALDSANLSNVVTEYVMYEDWAKRPAALSQEQIVADLKVK